MPTPSLAEREQVHVGGRQLRSYPAAFEIRTLAGSKVELTGYASTTGVPYEMNDWLGGYTEVVQPGAFGTTLAAAPDVAFLANHAGLTMARTVNATLRLSEDSTGLASVATLNTARSDARDLVTAVEDGDVDQMSFAFRVVRQQWSPDYDQRDLLELDLHRGDVSAVNYGANPDTSIGLQRAFAGPDGARAAAVITALRAGTPLDAAGADFAARALAALSATTPAPRRSDEDQPHAGEHLPYLAALRAQLEHQRQHHLADC